MDSSDTGLSLRTQDQLFTTTEVATLLDVPVSRVRLWLWAGRLRGQRRGGAEAGWRIRAEDLEQFVAPPPPAPTAVPLRWQPRR
jgi:excisionase family DNA binding protein